MSILRTTHFINIGLTFLVLIFAAVIGAFTSWSVNARDDSALVWENSCAVSDVLRENGAVEIRCFNDEQAVLASSHGAHVALIGNTPISERSTVPASCRSYQSGRWTCQVGGGDEFHKTMKVSDEAG